MGTDRPEPTMLDLESAQQEARREAAVSDQAAQLGTRTVRRLVERHIRWYAMAAIVLSVLISVVAGFLAVDASGRVSEAEVLRSQQQQLEAQQDRESQMALGNLEEANRALQARGQPPVTTPDPQDPIDTVTAAITAQVVSRIPPQPTAQQVASVLAPTVAANVTGPSASVVSARVADYLAANAGAVRGQRGEQGDRGEQGAAGPPPSLADIQAAVAAEYARNPPAPGRDGTNGVNGAAGVSQTGQQFVLAGGQCMSRVSYSDGRVVDSPAGAAACPDAPPPDSVEPTPTEGLIFPTD